MGSERDRGAFEAHHKTFSMCACHRVCVFQCEEATSKTNDETIVLFLVSCD